jgi:hypothetical protein
MIAKEKMLNSNFFKNLANFEMNEFEKNLLQSVVPAESLPVPLPPLPQPSISLAIEQKITPNSEGPKKEKF